MNTIICNKCGCSVEYATHTEISFQFGSCFDMEKWGFYMCDDCMKNFVKTFKIAPKGFMDDGYAPRLTPEQHQKAFEGWKDTGEWEQLAYIPYNELIGYRYYYEDEIINDCIRKYHSGKPLLD